MVFDFDNNQPVELVTLQLIDPQYSKVVMSRLSDYQGRFRFLPEPGEYTLKAHKQGYEHVLSSDVIPAGRKMLNDPIVIKSAKDKIVGDVGIQIQ